MAAPITHKRREGEKLQLEQEKITLENGFRIILEHNPQAKSCSMGVWVGSGSCCEDAQNSGISHFIEHMLFKGTLTRSSQEIARRADMMGGELNAYTDRECTCFYTRTLPADAYDGFELIADMLTSPKLDSADIELEKGVVTEEIAMYESNPSELCMDTFYLNAFPGCALGRNILGDRDTVASFTADMLREHMKKFYSPQRMVACFVGNFDRERMLGLCRRYFSGLTAPAPETALPDAEFRPGVFILKKRTEQNQVIIGFESCRLTDNRRFVFQLVSSMLGGSASSRLFRSLREEQGLVYSVDSYISSYLTAGVFTVSMGVSPKSERKAVQSAIKVLRDFPKTVTQQELELARSNYLAGMLMSLESSSAVAGRCGTGELLLGGAMSEEELERRIRAITLEDVVSAAEELTDFSKACICAVGKTAGYKFYNKVVSGQK